MTYIWKKAVGWTPIKNQNGKAVGQVNEKQRTIELSANCPDVEALNVCEAFPEWKITRAGERFVPDSSEEESEEKPTPRKRAKVIAWDMKQNKTFVFASRSAAMRAYGIGRRETIDELIATGDNLPGHKVWFDELYEVAEGGERDS